MRSGQLQTGLTFSPRRALRVTALAVFGSAGALVMALGIEACGSDSGTSGDRVTLATRVELVSDGQSFTTAQGWDVTLTRAVISTGPFYYFDGAPPLVQLEHLPRWQLAVDVLGIASALAHPGHYKAGEALGQMLDSWSVDLLAGGAELPTGEGVTGLYRSASFSFTSPPEGPMASGRNVLSLSLRGAAEVRFEEDRFFMRSNIPQRFVQDR